MISRAIVIPGVHSMEGQECVVKFTCSRCGRDVCDMWRKKGRRKPVELSFDGSMAIACSCSPLPPGRVFARGPCKIRSEKDV